MGAAESRYARALFAVTSDYRKTAEELDALTENLTADARFFLLNPSVSAEARRDTVLRLLSADASKEMKSFVSLLSDRKRLRLLPGIASAYKRLLTETGELLYITVASAYPLEETQYQRIGNEYMNKLRAKAFELTRVTDPSLLGGVRVQVGDKSSDGTLRMKLNKFKEFAI